MGESKPTIKGCQIVVAERVGARGHGACGRDGRPTPGLWKGGSGGYADRRDADIILPWRDYNRPAVEMVTRMLRGLLEL